jgi:RNA polymerase sigma-70 factor (ECF subfamily)
VKLWHRREELGAILNEKAYLMRSVVNTSLTYIAQNKKQKELTEYHLEADGTADRNILQKELEQKIETALEQLPPKCKAIFVLSRFENLKNKEIAATLGVSLKTVENQMGIALKKLRDELKSYFKGDLMPFLIMTLLPLLREFLM